MNFHVQLRPGETAQSSPLPHSGPSSPAQLPAAASARLLPTHPPTLHYTPHPTTRPCSRAAGAAGLLPARRVHPAAGGGRGGLCGEDAGECGDPLCISWKSCWRCRRPAGRAATRCAGWLPLWAAVGAGRGCRWGLHVREWRQAPYRDGTVEGALHGITMGTVGGIVAGGMVISHNNIWAPPTHTHPRLPMRMRTHATITPTLKPTSHTPHPPSNITTHHPNRPIHPLHPCCPVQSSGLLGYIDALSGGSISKVGVFSLGAWGRGGPGLGGWVGEWVCEVRGVSWVGV